MLYCDSVPVSYALSSDHNLCSNSANYQSHTIQDTNSPNTLQHLKESTLFLFLTLILFIMKHFIHLRNCILGIFTILRHTAFTARLLCMCEICGMQTLLFSRMVWKCQKNASPPQLSQKLCLSTLTTLFTKLPANY